MRLEDKEELIKCQDASFGRWYDVTYIPDYIDFKYHVNDFQKVCRKEKLRLDNINGWGTGTLFFITEENKLMVLNWASIIAMIPR